nr:NADH-quinone oxidoreductase subunit H [Ktedonobacteraceae bacterium]
MYPAIPLASDILTQLSQTIFSWQFLQYLILIVFAIAFVMTSAAVLVLLERKIVAWAQDRLGPIHTGPWGLLQSIADVGKLLMKEGIRSTESDWLVYFLAPVIFLGPVIGTFAVLAFSPYLSLPGTALATGIIYYVSMSSIDVVGVVMAGWGSNNKYSLIGGMRAVAQMISYELPLVLSLVGVIMVTSVLAGSGGYPGQTGIGTISIKDFIAFQDVWKNTGIGVLDFLFKGFTPWAWFVLVQPLMFIIYYICGLAETNRAP